MDTEKHPKLTSVSESAPVASIIVFLFLILLLYACGGNGPITATPSLQVIFPTDTPFLSIPAYSTPTISCLDGLTFIEDVTIPDYSIVSPGNTLDKQWLVQNSGSCNWDNRYRLRLISGVALGASIEQAIFPARAGAQAILQIIFTAPAEAGEYTSEWQAFDAKGISFGESFFIKIIVQ